MQARREASPADAAGGRGGRGGGAAGFGGRGGAAAPTAPVFPTAGAGVVLAPVGPGHYRVVLSVGGQEYTQTAIISEDHWSKR